MGTVLKFFKMLFVGFFVLGMTQKTALAVSDQDKAKFGTIFQSKEKCDKCHTVDALKIGKITEKGKKDDDEEDDDSDVKEAPDLSKLSDEVLKSKEGSDEYLSQYLKKKLKRKGKLHKKKFTGSDEDFAFLRKVMIDLNAEKEVKKDTGEVKETKKVTK